MAHKKAMGSTANGRDSVAKSMVVSLLLLEILLFARKEILFGQDREYLRVMIILFSLLVMV